MDPLAPLPLASAGGLLLSVNKGAAAIPPLLPTAGGKVGGDTAGAAWGRVGEQGHLVHCNPYAGAAGDKLVRLPRPMQCVLPWPMCAVFAADTKLCCQMPC